MSQRSPSLHTHIRALPWLAGGVVLALGACIESDRRVPDSVGETDADTDGDTLGETEVDSLADSAPDGVPDTSVECTDNSDCPVNLCVESMLCIGQRCIAGAEIPCAPTGNPCTRNVCAPTTGICSPEARDPATPCDDNDLCTRSDFCGSGGQAGTCVGGEPVQCEAPNDCMDVGQCNPLSGVCGATNRPDGSECESGVPPDGVGTMPGTCSSGTCKRLPLLKTGASHSCALLADDTLHCWGRNSSGQLGRGDEKNVGDGLGPTVAANPPVPLDGITAFGLGLSQTCVISHGELRCWGSNNSGGLGYPAAGVYGSSPTTTPDKLPAVNLGGDFEPVAVAPSLGASCALSAAGGVACWGTASTLGYPGFPEVGVAGAPSIIEAGLVQLAPAGQQFVVSQLLRTTDLGCAISEGRLRCWGRSPFLGLETNDDVGDDEPPSEARLLNTGWVAAQISSIREHACAVSTVGDVYCWGRNIAGQLGTGDAFTNGSIAGPLFLGAGRVGRKVAAGSNHTCLLMANDEVICWGTNANGVLGLGHTHDWYRPATAATVLLGGPVWDIAAGWDHTCAVLRNGEIRCWGLGQEGRLGTGSPDNIGDEESDLPPARIVF